jgi:hypothetical protein
MARTTVGIYATRVAAEDAVSGLKAAGFRDDEITLTARDWDGWFQVTVAADGLRVAVARNGGPARGRLADHPPVST